MFKIIIRYIVSAVFFVAFSSKAVSSPGIDIEIDPFAYALDGYSLHLGVSGGFGRLDLGAFALKLDETMLGEKGYEADFKGLGIKWDNEPAHSAGGFYGLEASRNLVSYLEISSQESIERYETQYGLRLGYRFNFSNLYLVPWLGLGRFMGERDVRFQQNTLKRPSASIFPTLHIGYRFD